jgi:hypothetical protein
MNKILIITATAILLSGCGGETTTKVEIEYVDKPIFTPTPIPTPENIAPTITGTPLNSLLAHTEYSFSPIATDNDDDPLVFSISNKPDWAEFNTSSGELKGTPSEEGYFENINISVSDQFHSVGLTEFSITVIENNQAPIISNQTLETMESTDMMITLGPEVDTDGDSIQYSITDSANIEPGTQPNEVMYNSAFIGVETLQITANDNNNDDVTATINITTSPTSSSNYLTTRDLYNWNEMKDIPAPLKGESIEDKNSGAKITRLTDASELPGTADALIVYSRYTPENTNGKYFLTFGDDSNTCWLIERTTGDVIKKLTHNLTKNIGESHEIRWDLSEENHNRIYYRYDMGLYMIDDVTQQPITSTLIKDFSSDVPTATKIYNDVEGDSSNNSKHWAFMAAHYDGANYVVDAFIHYQMPDDPKDISNQGITHILTAADLTGSALSHYAESNQMPRPNMIEINPTGTGVVLHFGRSWVSGNQSNRPEDAGTYFDGPHLWSLDFDYETNPPVKISISETHAGWAWDDEGREMFISQNNTTDKLDAVYTYGENAGYENRIEIASHSDFGWSNGFHYGKMPRGKKGWAFINTYSNANSGSHESDWASDQLIMLKIDNESNNPIVWRVAPNYNNFTGNYRDEAPAAINTFGNRIYVSSNWGEKLPNREVFLIEIPSNWNTILDAR